MKEIVQKEHEVLRQVAKLVPLSEITGPKIKKILADMQETLGSQEDGVAIAAPQIGVPLRIFVVSPQAFDIQAEMEKDRLATEGKEAPAPAHTKENLVFINPEITKLSKKKVLVDEGCLSVRWLYGEVKRATNATVRAYNEKGEQFTRGAGGLLAQIFQHETDHLDGTLFIDSAKNIQEIRPNHAK